MRWRCETCDFHGPELPTMLAAARDFHRAGHDLWRLAVESWGEPVVKWLSQRLTVVTR